MLPWASYDVVLIGSVAAAQTCSDCNAWHCHVASGASRSTSESYVSKCLVQVPCRPSDVRYGSTVRDAPCATPRIREVPAGILRAAPILHLG